MKYNDKITLADLMLVIDSIKEWDGEYIPTRELKAKLRKLKV